jgi:hypothetical protein
LKFMLFALFELKALDEKMFMTLSQNMEEVGRMLFGWKNQLAKQNHPQGFIPLGGNKKE